MKLKKKLSVIVSYYNNSTILECLLWVLYSIKNLREYNYEILVVDDSSKYPLSNPVLDFLKKNRIDYFKKEKNSGISEVRNTAIDLTDGEIIVFLDADCYVKEDYFKTLCNTFNKYKNGGMVYGKREPYRDKFFSRFRELKYQYKSGKYQEKKIRKFTRKDRDFYLVSGQNMAIRRNVLENVGYFVRNIGCEDIEMQYLIMDAGYPTIYNPKLIVYHNHPHKFFHYIKKAFRYGRGFQRFKDRQEKNLKNNKYYRIYMGYGKVFEKFMGLKNKNLRNRVEVWAMEMGDYLANKMARFYEKHFARKPKSVPGAYGIVYCNKKNKLAFLVAKYNKEYGLLGGRLKKGEGIRKGFIRELGEEINIKLSDINRLFLTNLTHSFESSRVRGLEKHYFFIVKLKKNASPIKGETDFEWLNASQMHRICKWKKTQEIINSIVNRVRKNENLRISSTN